MDYTPAQAEAIAHRGPQICVDAGAGSGKTRVLVDRIVAILDANNAGLDEVVAITFTEKAAAEMRERLRAAFRAKVPDDDPDNATRWRELERRADNARIGTIHGFCAGILRENALWLGLDPDFSVLTDHNAVLLRRDCVKRILHKLLEEGDAGTVRLTCEFKPEEIGGLVSGLLAKRDILENTLESLPTDEAALSELWTELVKKARTEHLENLKYEPRLWRYLRKLQRFEGACENPSDGREELRLRAIQGINRIIEGAPPIETVSILEDLAGKHGRAAGKNWSDNDTWKAISKIEDDFKTDIKSRFLPSDELNPEIEATSIKYTLDILNIYKQVRDAFDAEKIVRNGMDFEDLISRARKALRANNEVCSRTAQRIKFLLIDEFQDTDRGQLEIAELLCNVKGGPSLFVVGDVKQSIYYFRGAEVGVFNEVRHNAGKLINLDTNFRSQPGVLNFVNDFFKQSRLLSSVEDYTSLQSHRPQSDTSCVEFLLSEADAKRSSEERRQAEADLIARRIATACYGPRTMQLPDADGATRSAQPGDFALLFRRMGDVDLYERALREQGIPYTLVAGSGFYKRQEIIDVLNLLKVLLDPWDECALLGFLRSPMAGLTDTSLYHLTRGILLSAAFASECGLEDEAENQLLEKARSLVAELRKNLTNPVPELLRHMLNLTAYEAVLLAGPHGVRKTANIRKLLQLANAFARSGQQSLHAYMEYVETLRTEAIREGEAGLQPDGEGGVTIMTIHKSKGLEFPVVILPDLGSRIQGGRGTNYLLHRDLGFCLKVRAANGELATPLLGQAIGRKTATDEAAERARLLYVAMTRARDYLILSGGTDIESGSWLDDFESVYDISSLNNGQIINGDGWSAKFCTEAGDEQRSKKNKSEIPEVTIEDLVPNTTPLNIQPPLKETYAISTVLNLMSGIIDEQDERTNSDEGYPSAEAQFALARGTLVHRLFELWRFDSSPPNIHELITDGDTVFPNPTVIETDLRRITTQFAASALGKRLTLEAKIRREVPFLLDLGGPLLSGCIDALLNDGTIIDYKTGRINPDRHHRYEWQLLLYAAAVCELSGSHPKEGLLCYVDANEVHVVPFNDKSINDTLILARTSIQNHQLILVD